MNFTKIEKYLELVEAEAPQILTEKLGNEIEEETPSIHFLTRMSVEEAKASLDRIRGSKESDLQIFKEAIFASLID